MSALKRPRFFTHKIILAFVFCLFWALLFVISPMAISSLSEYFPFSLLGIIGAIFANATGAGGGVIFIPMFNHLNFTEQQAIATSFAIQCFGMTAGAVTWAYHYKTTKMNLRLWRGFKTIISLASFCSVLGLTLVYYFHLAAPNSLHHNFSWFSLLLGSLILAILLWFKPERERSTLAVIDFFLIGLITLLGGVLTAWLSVGVGELLAIYLILRRFDVTMAVAVAVIVSAISVWFAIWQYVLVEFVVVWQVVLFAGPSAILGGVLAKTLVTHLSARKLKLFFACWLLISGFAGL